MNQKINLQSRSNCDEWKQAVYEAGNVVITVESVYAGEKDMTDLFTEYLRERVAGNNILLRGGEEVEKLK